ncbi:uncharacterized protein RB166_008648 [Leptodactylus fuscus]
MKKSIILWCVTCCLLSAFQGNEGSKVNDSLNCVMEYPEDILNCSWSEKRSSRQFVNMTLMEEGTRPWCVKIERQVTPTHVISTCQKSLKTYSLYYGLKFIFLPERSLESYLNVSSEGDEAKPKNLQCQVSDHRMISCSWEVRPEVADSVDFALYYQNSSQREQVCQPRCQQGNSMYLFCSCNFTASDPKNPIQLRNISVGPADVKTSFKICKHIKLGPRILTVEETSKGDAFLISWKNETNGKPGFNYHYQLCYWRAEDLKPEKVPFDCPGVNKTLSPNHDPRVYLTLENGLRPSSIYSVKVRVRLGETNPDSCYKGPWSEWSNVETFHTRSVPNILLLCILVLSAVVVLTICLVCGYRALVRYTKQWDDRIPSPSKSSIIKSLHKAKDRLVIRYLTLQNGPSFPCEEHLYVEPCNNVMMWGSSKKDTNFMKQDVEEFTRPSSELLQDDDTQCLVLFNMTTEEYPTAYPTASVTDGYKPFAELIDEQENENMEDSQFTVCAFDGPYLLS